MKNIFKKLFSKKKKTHFYSTDVWSEIADKYFIKDKIIQFVHLMYEPFDLERGLVLYGEIYGPGIQKNFDYGLKEIEFVGFDIKVDEEYCAVHDCDYALSLMGLPKVPLLYEDVWSKEIQDKFVYNQFIEGTKIPHEGIVIKHISGDRQKVAKVINPDYLIYAEKKDVGDSH